ncbi:MAG: hypothetical protein ABJB11_16535 [Ferruginibacter sp.]
MKWLMATVQNIAGMVIPPPDAYKKMGEEVKNPAPKEADLKSWRY